MKFGNVSFEGEVMLPGGASLTGDLASKLDSSVYAGTSGGFSSAQSTVASSSGAWQGTVSTVNANSAQWAAGTSGGAAQSDLLYVSGQVSGKLNASVYSAASGSWQSTYSTVSANSGAWGAGGGVSSGQLSAYALSADVSGAFSNFAINSAYPMSSMLSADNGRIASVFAGQYDSPVFQETMNANDNGNTNMSFRTVIPSTKITGRGMVVKVTFRSSSDSPLTVTHASIANRSGSTGSATTTPVELKFGGSSGFSITAGQSIKSDSLVFQVTGGDCLVTIDASSNGNLGRRTSDASYYSYYGAGSYYDSIAGPAGTIASTLYCVTQIVATASTSYLWPSTTKLTDLALSASVSGTVTSGSLWNSAYSTVAANSGQWAVSGTSGAASYADLLYVSGQVSGKLAASVYSGTSGGFYSTQTTVASNSASWVTSGALSAYALSANVSGTVTSGALWNSAYSTVASNSAQWALTGASGAYLPLSGGTTSGAVTVSGDFRYGGTAYFPSPQPTSSGNGTLMVNKDTGEIYVSWPV